MARSLAAALAVVVSAGAVAADEAAVLTAAEVVARPRPPANAIVHYGPGELQWGELRLPETPGSHPLALVIHGGCWLAEYDLGYVSGLAAALADAGIATLSVEYRRVGDEGGGWPGTFADVAAAADHVRELAATHALDLDRVVAVGHSAGGHLAVWLAARRRLGDGDPLQGPDPLPLAGVVALAGIFDLAAYAAPDGCGSAVPALLGGAPDDVPDRLRRASPIELAPLGIRQVLVTGSLDAIVPGEQARRYARRAGAEVEIREVADAGHFELVVPGSIAWPVVRDAVLEIVRHAPTAKDR